MLMNPFILTAYHSPEYFCDREEETERLIKSIENNRSISLISQRRMGKTGLLKHIEYNLVKSKDLNFVYFDIMSTSSVKDFVNLFANSLFKSNKSKLDTYYKSFVKIFSSFKPSIVINPFTNETKFSIDLADEQEGINSLESIFNYIDTQSKKIVIAIDEFQQILDYPENKFEATLRSFYQNSKNSVFIFSGSRKEILTSMFKDKNRPFYLSVDFMFLQNINKAKYNQFISEKFAKAKRTISDSTVDYILDLVNIHTFYVQNLCNRLYSSDFKKIEKDDVDKIFLKILAENKYYFESYKNILTDNQWKLLSAIAQEISVKEITSKEFLSNHQLGSASSVSTSAKSLLDKEFIIKDENGNYKLQDIFFSAWLRTL